jgi:hypothetical protein
MLAAPPVLSLLPLRRVGLTHCSLDLLEHRWSQK